MKITQYVGRMWEAVKAHWIVSLLAILVVGGGVWWYQSANQADAYKFIAVTQGAIAETVSVTGSTQPVESVSLAFQNSGTIARVYHKVGDRVRAGEVLAVLNTANLSAALQQAQAAYNSAVASRSSTSLPETAVEARNTYLSGYTTLDTVLHGNVDPLFGAATPYGPQLLIHESMYNYGELSRDRASIDDDMVAYHAALSSAASTEPLDLLDRVGATTQKVSTFLNKLAIAAQAQNSGATDAQIASLTAGRASVDALLAKISTARDLYRTNSVGATSLADASVEQAAAGVAVAKANLQGTQIVAPIDGVVTVFDAKVGQIASPGAQLVSLISANAFEVEAGVSETDIGKVAVGNTVAMTLDAFSDKVFTGRVFYIDPAQTSTQGVVDYKIKVSFDVSDSQMKSGLTANLDIQTRSKDNVLLLPQYAILQNDRGAFAKMLKDGAVVEVPVKLGIQDAQGMVEILSGVAFGDQVLNIGLKQ